MSDLTKLAEWPKRLWATECVGYYGAHYWDVSQTSRDDTSIPVLVFPADQAPEPVAGTIKQAIYLETALSPADIKTITDYMVKHEALAAELAEVKKELGAAQAQIDALMFEFCAYRMTPEQVQRWSDAQRPVRGANE